MYIDQHERQDHFLWINLINGTQTFNEMRRWIDVRAPLPDVREQFGKKSRAYRVRSLLVPVNRPARLIRKPGPARNPGRERMRKIDISFGGEGLLDFPKR